MLNRIPRLATKLSALVLLLAPAACSDSPSRVVAPDVEARQDMSGIPSSATTSLTKEQGGFPFYLDQEQTRFFSVGPFLATGGSQIGQFAIYCINIMAPLPVNTTWPVRSLTFEEATGNSANLKAIQRTLGNVGASEMLTKLRQSAYLSGQFKIVGQENWEELHFTMWKLFPVRPDIALQMVSTHPNLETVYLDRSAEFAASTASTNTWRILVDDRAWDDNVATTVLRQTVIANNEQGLGNFVWHDMDADGIQDSGEPGIGEATVIIKGPNGFEASTKTDASGAYQFPNLAAGAYTVCVATPAGYTDASPAGRGEDGRVDSDGRNPGNCAEVTLPPNEFNPNIDFGFFQSAALGDYTWIDANGNGRQDAGEPALNGVQLHLSGASSATQTTANGGKYLFSSLAPGSYTVKATAPAGFTFTTANSPLATDANNSNANPTTVTLAAGENNLNIDFGFVPLPGSGQGCTPGFWKQSQKFGNWKWYTRGDMVNDVFGVTFTSSARNNPTGPLNLLQALELNGNGGAEQLFRHGTAALLNAVYQSGVSYQFTAPQVITMVRTAWESRNATTIANTHRELSAANERGCPLN